MSTDSGTSGTILVVLGLIVGLLNISQEETHNFLLAGIALLLVGSFAVNILPFLGDALTNALVNLGQFVAPAVLVIALKTVFSAGRST